MKLFATTSSLLALTLHLGQAKFASLALLCGIDDYTKLFSGSSTDNHADVKQSQPVIDLQQPNLPDIESVLHVEHAEMIAELEKKLADDPEFACCSCERLLQRKNVTAFEFSESKKLHVASTQGIHVHVGSRSHKQDTICVSVLPAHSEPGQAAVQVCSEWAGS